MRGRKILRGGGGGGNTYTKPMSHGLSVLKAHFKVPGHLHGWKMESKSRSERVRSRQKSERDS